jgi:DNA-binding PadR family transcriptional regulator
MDLKQLLATRDRYIREALVKTLAKNPALARDVFLCHSSADKPFVRRLASDLERLAIRPWLDAWELAPGDSLLEKIGDGLNTAKYFCIILSKAHRGSRFGLGRLFAHGDLRLVILHLIAEQPRHGYDIIKAIEDQVGGTYSPSAGVVYPTLTMLEELGYVTVSTGDGAKKLHTITAEGQAYLDSYRPTLDALLARMAEANRTYGGGPTPQILRAMENLKLALQLRLSRGPLSEEQINAVAAAIDGAAVSVERT